MFCLSTAAEAIHKLKIHSKEYLWQGFLREEAQVANMTMSIKIL